MIDTVADRAYATQDPGRLAAVESAACAPLSVPLMREDDELIGAISVHRREVRAFTDKQIELVCRPSPTRP